MKIPKHVAIILVLDEEELQEAFARVYEHLETGGVFLFEYTEHRL